MSTTIDDIKQANRIEDVIQESGYELTGTHRRYLKCRQHDSLVIDTHAQYYVWNSKNESGDVINWVERTKRTDFKGAMEYLARRAGLPEPNWSGESQQQRLAARTKETALTVACRRFVHRLWTDDKALAYARSRGWTDDTIKAAGLGFTGHNTPDQLAELRKDFANADIPENTPGAVAMLGMKGPVSAWLDQQNIQEFPSEWLTKKSLPPIWKGMLVYPHVVGGRVVYVSLRSIGEKSHHNLRSAFVGPRQLYFNHVYSPKEDAVVVVEGQADAITLAQWEIPAVALAGVTSGVDLRKLFEGHKHIYVALDKDKAGNLNAQALAKELGPLCRMVEWPAHDANDWLKELVDAGVEPEEQAAMVRELMDQAQPLVMKMAGQAGGLRGADRDEAVKAAMAVVASMSDQDKSLYRNDLARLMGLELREFNYLLRTVQKDLESQAKADEDEGIQEIVGGFIKGWLIELMYKPDENRTLFAYRDPDGKIGTAKSLEIEGVVYKPKAPDDLITQGVVVLPSEIGDELREKELVAMVVDLVHRHYLIDEFFEHLIAYYVLFTWAFDSFRNLVYLRMLGDYGSGKTQLMMIAGYLCRRLMMLSGTASDASLYRTMHIYKGTLFIDEGDKTYSDTDSPWVKILNTGDRRGFPVVRMREAGQGRYEPEAFDVFGPKLLTTRNRFEDDALESRCLTIEVVKHTTRELVNRNIPIHLEKAFFDEAAALRNVLLRWRLRIWQPDVEMDEELVDPMVQARLNQVMMPIMQIVKDGDVRKEIRNLVRRYQQRMTTEKSLTLEAKVLQAIIEIQEASPVSRDENGEDIEPYWDLSVGNITSVANAIIDEENADPDEEEGSKSGGKKLTTRGVGALIRKRLNLETKRHTGGPLKGNYVLVWHEERVNGLRVEYGLGEVE
ncbi:MAG: toprim domain-containing protein [Chloroflexi bacterium]|nr:MAG: toprim domain-containing protein [Chloroflexota bacterium]